MQPLAVWQFTPTVSAWQERTTWPPNARHCSAVAAVQLLPIWQNALFPAGSSVEVQEKMNAKASIALAIRIKRSVFIGASVFEHRCEPAYLCGFWFFVVHLKDPLNEPLHFC
jgi:hypothetical protein